MPAPTSLAKRQSWRTEEVLARLSEDFLGKCYLCEQRMGRASFQVDHRRPKGEGAFKKHAYEWTNLFPACEYCNAKRPRKWPEGGLLDPAGDEDVEGRLRQQLDDRQDPQFSPTDEEDVAALNTARELDTIHNAPGPKGEDLRDAIRRQLSLVLSKTIELLKPDAPRIEIMEELRLMLSRRAPFTMLIRSRVGGILDLEELFD